MTKMTLRGLVVSIAMVLAAACGEDRYGDPLPPNPAQSQAANEMVSSLSDLDGLAQAEGSSALDGVGALYGHMMEIVSLKLAQQQGAFGAVLAGEPGAEADGAFTRLPRPADLRALADVWFDEGCVVETPTSVTFTDCRWDGGRIDGFARYEGGTLTVDLTVEAAYAGSSFTFRERGSISISDTRIAGDLTIDVDASGGGNTVAASFAMDLDVTLTAGCPTAGFVELHAEGSATGGGRNASFDVWVKAVFGPACGDVTLY